MSRPLPLDAMDSRTVLIGYAAPALVLGLGLCLWGPLWIAGPLNGLPFGLHSLVRMIGAVVFGAGLSALAMSQIGDPLDRRRSLLWFAFAHAALLLMAFSQSISIWDQSTRRELFWLLVAIGMAFIWLTIGWLRQAGDPEPLGVYFGLFGQRPTTATERMRSQYEQHIRSIGAQEERHRLARDLHDSVKQQIFAIQTAAATAQVRFTSDPSGAQAALAQVRDAARDSMAEMDAMLDQLRVTPLDNTSLVTALRQQCDAVRIRTGAAVTCDLGPLPPERALQPGTHLALSRIAQEALSNAARHARAAHITVTLRRSGSRLELTITDDGKGFVAANNPAGMGLRNVRARASELGGEAHVGSTPDQGTTVFVTVPVTDADPAYYLKRSALMLAIATFFVATTIGGWAQGRGRYSLMLLVPILLDATRYGLAWRRARHLRGTTA